MSVREQVLAASAGRDRVTDFVKSAALLLVVIGHSLAWYVLPDGGIDNTLNHAPRLWWLTWVLQILPVFFFIAGAGLVRLAREKSSRRYLARASGLLEPAVLLLFLALVVATVLRFTSPVPTQRAVGTLMVQLTWFIGVYLLLISLAPLLIRLGSVPAGTALLCAIALVDVIRVRDADGLGWLNMILVWAFFAVLGTQLERLRAARRWVLATAAVTSLAAGTTLIIVGPYAKALITATTIPGISNLAPPTLVLAFAGAAQVFSLLLAWPLLQRWLSQDRVWVPVAVFGSRAMQIYLYHLIFIMVLVAPFIVSAVTSDPLSPGWWWQHLLVFVLVLAATFAAAPVLRQMSTLLARLVLIAPWSRRHRERLVRMPTAVARALMATTGLLLLIQSATGVGDYLTARRVVALDVYPIATWVLLMLCIAAQLVATNEQSDSAHH